MEALYFAAGTAAMLGMTWLRTRWFGFLAQKPSDYSGASGEALDLRKHLSGPIQCDGVIFGPFGRVTSRFTARFDATWEGNRGRMTEDFTYDSGATQRREWHLTLGNDGRVTATAPDVVGEGLGRIEGPALQLRYRIRLPAESGGHVLDTTDWMYLAPNGTIVNRSQFRKFGIKVAELVATMRRKEAA